MTKKQDWKGKKEDDEDEDEWVMADPPDGGWGWVVVFCSFMIHVIVDGVTYTFGIFHMEFLKDFKESNVVTSWVSSIMVGTTFCVGPFASGLTNQFGCRAITIVGSLLASFGLIISTFAPSITFLYFSIGICTGAGFGLMYLPAIVCVTCYFEKMRAFATGIAVCGTGIGTFVLAPVTEILVDAFGWQGAMLVVSGFVLNCCVFGCLFRPLEKKRAPPRQPELRPSIDVGVAETRNGALRKGSLPNGAVDSDGVVRFNSPSIESMQMQSKSLLGINHNHNPNNLNFDHQIKNSTSMTLSCASSQRSSSRRRRSGPMARRDSLYSGSLCKLPEYTSNPNMYSSKVFTRDVDQYDRPGSAAASPKAVCGFFRVPPAMKEAFQEMMNFHLMGNALFLMFGFSNFFTNIGFNVPFVYTKDRAVGLGMANERQASYLLSVIGIANTIGRVVLGYLSDLHYVNRLWLYNGSLTLCGLATAFSYFCTTYYLMVLYAVIFGATAGAYVSLTSVILVDLLGLDKLTNAFGLLLLFEGVACLIGPPITGWLYDYLGSYDPGFFVSGIMIALSGLMLFFIPCLQKTLNSRKQRKDFAMQNVESPSSTQHQNAEPI